MTVLGRVISTFDFQDVNRCLMPGYNPCPTLKVVFPPRGQGHCRSWLLITFQQGVFLFHCMIPNFYGSKILKIMEKPPQLGKNFTNNSFLTSIYQMLTDYNFLLSSKHLLLSRGISPQIERGRRGSLGRKMINLDLNKFCPDQFPFFESYLHY